MIINGRQFRQMIMIYGHYFDQQLISLYVSGLTSVELSQKFNVSGGTMRYWLTRLGIMRSQSESMIIAWQKGRWSREKKRDLAYTSGFNKSSIGKTRAHKGKPLPQAWRDNISKAMTGLRVGENHPLWKGGVSIKNYGPGWKPAKRQALQRANGKCQRCKNPATLLHVHHKVPAKFFHDVSDAHHQDNLIVVCPPCHKILEKAMWTLPTTTRERMVPPSSQKSNEHP